MLIMPPKPKQRRESRSQRQSRTNLQALNCPIMQTVAQRCEIMLHLSKKANNVYEKMVETEWSDKLSNLLETYPELMEGIPAVSQFCWRQTYTQYQKCMSNCPQIQQKLRKQLQEITAEINVLQSSNQTSFSI